MPKVTKNSSQTNNTQTVKNSPYKTTENEKYERRLAANRRSASKSRYRRKVMLDELQETVVEMTASNAALRKENEEIRRQLTKYMQNLPAVVEGSVPLPAGSTDVDTSATQGERMGGSNNVATSGQLSWVTHRPTEPITQTPTGSHLHDEWGGRSIPKLYSQSTTTQGELLLGGSNAAAITSGQLSSWLTNHRPSSGPMTQTTTGSHLQERGVTTCRTDVSPLEVQSMLYFGQQIQANPV